MRLPRTFADQCFVLKRSNYGESDKILVVFGRRWGKFSAIAKGVRKLTSKKAPHLEPYNLTKLAFASSNFLPIVTQAETINHFSPDHLDLAAATQAFQLGEVILELLNEGENYQAIFDRFRSTLDKLDQTDWRDAEAVAETFHRFLLVELGFGLPQDGVALVDHLEHLLDRRLRSFRLGQI